MSLQAQACYIGIEQSRNARLFNKPVVTESYETKQDKHDNGLLSLNNESITDIN